MEHFKEILWKRTMNNLKRILPLILCFCFTPAIAQLTEIGITKNLAVGEVIAIDKEKNEIQLKTKDGVILVNADAQTEFKRILSDKPTNLTASISSNFTEIVVDDRIIAQGVISNDKKTIAARRVILMTKTEIRKKQETERQKWLKNGVAGRITAIEPTKNEITVSVRVGANTLQTVIVATNTETKFRRYASASASYGDSQPSNFSELKINDQFRGYGEKSQDGKQLFAKEIIFGSFSIVAGNITALNGETGEVTINDILTKKEVKIIVQPPSLLRRFPPEMATKLAKIQNSTTRKENEGTDIDTTIEKLPKTDLSELKVGEAIAASCITEPASGNLIVVKLVAGVEPFLKSAQTANSSPLSAPTFNIPGLEGIIVP